MARSFGTSDHIQIGFTTPVSTPLSWSCWLLPGGPSGTNIAVARDAAGGGANGMYIGPLYELFANGVTWSQSTFTTTVGTWCQLGFSCTTDANGISFYANGAAAGTDAGNKISSGATNWWIGNDSANRPAGTIVDFAFWNVILTAGEFSALGQGVRPYQIRPSALIGWWPLDGLQSPEPDLSGSAHNGTLSGTSLAAGAPTMLFTPRWPRLLLTGAASSGSMTSGTAAGMGTASGISPGTSSVFRRTLSVLGTRIGSRQPLGAM